ncbi:fatty acid-binding protein-like [Saccoglossus kowalevskii]|uniref:Fatty acid-binding protein-like n=1 Tax=Saccoglossus kowalevskii TaxID=10224 RepID=A0ABM0MNH3_SACKO|nr:PREDICTED: fatty acid-binding protein-like [Saccoglossus kowalevskii]
MAFQGKWKHVNDDDQFDAFLDALGANALAKKVAKEIHPTFEYEKDGDTYIMRFVGFGGPTTRECKFKDGEEFDHPASIIAPGETRKVVAKILSDTAVELKTTSGTPDISEVREVVGEGEMTNTITYGTVSCKRFFKKVTE